MDAYLIVDPDARTIEVPEVEKVFGVYGDNNAERKYFKCPRIVGNKVDLSKCYIYVNYISAATKVGQIMCDIGDVDGVDTNGDEIVFSWPITRNVLDKNESTNIFFAVQAKTTTGDTVFTTRKAEGFCYESIEGTETVAEEYADIVLQLISRMDNVEANIGEQVAAYFKENPAVTAEYLDQTLQPVKNDVSQLKEDLGYIVKITETKSTNKLKFTDVEQQEKNGVTMYFKDNVLFLNGTPEVTTEFTIPISDNLQDGIYKFYYELLEGVFNQTILYGYQSNSYAQFVKNTVIAKDTNITGQNRSKISLTKGRVFENCKFHIWAELSSEATGVFSIPETTHKDITLNDDLEIPQVKENKDKIDNVQKILGVKQEYTIIDGKMVFNNGTIKSDTNSVCINLKLEAGDTIVFKATASAHYSIISESTPDFSKIINAIVVGVNNDEATYEYTATQDIYIVLSCRSNKEYSIKKILYS